MKNISKWFMASGRSLLAAGAVAMSLVACSPSQVTSITTSLLQDVDNAVITGCAAFPSVDSVLALLNAGVAATASALATAFCTAFTANAAPAPAPGPAPAALLAKKGTGATISYYCTPTNSSGYSVCGWK